MKTIILARHAKSDWSQNLSDFDRPLNPRGERDAPRMGDVLAEYEFHPDLIISSPANRALSTAEAIAEKIGYTSPLQQDRRIYDEGHGTLISIIQEIPREVNTAMIFGHNPTMESAVGYLLQSSAGIAMPTCALACLEIMTGDWKHLSPKLITLKWFLIPKLIP
jgi:phosphohistidine phosphatase